MAPKATQHRWRPPVDGFISEPFDCSSAKPAKPQTITFPFRLQHSQKKNKNHINKIFSFLKNFSNKVSKTLFTKLGTCDLQSPKLPHTFKIHFPLKKNCTSKKSSGFTLSFWFYSTRVTEINVLTMLTTPTERNQYIFSSLSSMIS